MMAKAGRLPSRCYYKTRDKDNDIAIEVICEGVS